MNIENADFNIAVAQKKKDKTWRIIPSQTKRCSIEPCVFPDFPNFIAAGSYTTVDGFNKNYIGIQTTSSSVYQANLGKN